MQEIEIRKIEFQEVGLVVDLFNKYRIFYEQASDLDLAKTYLTDRMRQKEAVIYLATIKDAPIGFTLLYPRYSSVLAKRNWHIGDLYIEKGHRKKGLGALLIEQAIHFAKDDKANFITLNTAEDNMKAQRLYERIGFKQKIGLTGFLGYQYLLE